MKNKLKSMLSLFLAVVMIVGVIPTVIAEEADLQLNDIIANEEIGETGEIEDAEDAPVVDPTPDPEPEPNPNPEPEAEPGPKPDPKPDDVVGEIFLCFGGNGLGHLWVYFINTSDEPLTIGLYEIPPGEGISIGTFGFTRFDGPGIYYNMEARRNERYCGSSYIRLKDSLTREEAENVTSTILTANYWDPFFNCTTFACRVWNRASNIPMVPMVLPPFVAMFMAMWGANGSEKMQYQPPENCYKQRGTGSGAYLEECCDASINA